MQYIRVLMATAVFLTPFSGIAATETFRLICTYSHTVDDRGLSKPTASESLIAVTKFEGGRAILRKEGLGAEFTGAISEEEISGETEYKMQETTYKETLHINRFTGSFMFSFGTQSGAGLVHYGNCRPASKQLF